MAQFFTDFSEYTSDAQPSDWTENWAPSGFTTLVRDTGLPTGFGAKGLEFDITSNALSAASWDDADIASGNVEVVVKFAASSYGNVTHFPAIICGSGSSGSENAYYVEFAAAAVNLRRVVSGTGAVLDTFAFSPSDGTAYWVRLQKSSTTIRCRVWADGDSEPGTWGASAVDTSHSSGWQGIGGLLESQPVLYIDKFGAGTAGDEAPTSVGPTISAMAPDGLIHTSADLDLYIGGTNFGSSQGSGSVIISPTDDVDDASAITQAITSWSDTLIQTNGVDITDLVTPSAGAPYSALYVFVKEDGGESNASGAQTLGVEAAAYVYNRAQEQGTGAVTFTLTDLTGAAGPLVSGDVLCVQINVAESNVATDWSGSTVHSDFSGNELYDSVPTGGSPPSLPHMSVWYHEYDGGEPSSYTFTFEDSGTGLVGTMFLIRNVDTDSPLDQTVPAANTTTTDSDPPSITTVTDNALVVEHCCKDDGGEAITALSSGYTTSSLHGASTGGNGSYLGIGFKWVDDADTAENPGVTTGGNDETVAGTVAWRAQQASVSVVRDMVSVGLIPFAR